MKFYRDNLRTNATRSTLFAAKYIEVNGVQIRRGQKRSKNEFNYVNFCCVPNLLQFCNYFYSHFVAICIQKYSNAFGCTLVFLCVGNTHDSAPGVPQIIFLF